MVELEKERLGLVERDGEEEEVVSVITHRSFSTRSTWVTRGGSCHASALRTTR